MTATVLLFCMLIINDCFSLHGNCENPIIFFLFRYLRSSHYKDFLESANKKSAKSFAIAKLSSAKLNLASAKEQLKVGLSSSTFQL